MKVLTAFGALDRRSTSLDVSMIAVALLRHDRAFAAFQLSAAQLAHDESIVRQFLDDGCLLGMGYVALGRKLRVRVSALERSLTLAAVVVVKP